MMLHAAKIDPAQNLLLAALSAEVLDRLLPRLKLIDMPRGRVLYEPGFRMENTYFPTHNCIVGKCYVTNEGASTGISVVGNEGMVGMSLLMGDGTHINQGTVLSPGQAFQLEQKLLKAEFDSNNELQRLLLRYAQAVITQTELAVACNRRHSIEQQLCRLLLLCLDRREDEEIWMTQELIANMLGVRREGVTAAANKLRVDGLIRYCRGHIKVFDRLGLEARACECYGVVKQEYDRLLP
ncbi:MAG: transcriptional regulator Crp/FNR family [Gammaproteobacteria bacterium]|nr:MAG: transcriptional regulator Crp/FNR family [Gammaproteobacteria bacterium]TND02929.1 MAG: transcriptional regulator, Crp/FNR family [Gammaproteobacteria bacterium]